jgi:hypothetical protein
MENFLCLSLCPPKSSQPASLSTFPYNLTMDEKKKRRKTKK